MNRFDATNPDRAGGDGGNGKALVADYDLAKRCVAGEVAAWEELHAQCHQPLRTSIKVMLGPGNGDAHLVDEIAARVWYALIENDGKRLVRYNPGRGARLITFMRTMAKTEITRHFRAEGRRRKREQIALRARPPHQTEGDAQTTALLLEFVPTLTVGERAFYDDHLAGRPSGGEAALGREPRSANARQLRHRIREKLLRFLGYGPRSSGGKSGSGSG